MNSEWFARNIVVLGALVVFLFAGCAFYPGVDEAEYFGRPDGVTECAWLCDQANEWSRACGMPNRPPLDRVKCIARLEANQWPVDPEICEFNAWCYAGYRWEGYCEELVIANKDSTYWQPFISLPELGCRNEWDFGS